jgi:hypothetical protein
LTTLAGRAWAAESLAARSSKSALTFRPAMVSLSRNLRSCALTNPSVPMPTALSSDVAGSRIVLIQFESSWLGIFRKLSMSATLLASDRSMFRLICALLSFSKSALAPKLTRVFSGVTY